MTVTQWTAVPCPRGKCGGVLNLALADLIGALDRHDALTCPECTQDMCPLLLTEQDYRLGRDCR